MRNWRKTLPKAQRTQGIASITWVSLQLHKKNANSVENKIQEQGDQKICIAALRCIGSNLGHQVALLASVTSLATRWWRHLHCHTAYDCPIDMNSWYWVVIFISQSQSQSFKMVLDSVWDTRTHRSDQGYLSRIKRPVSSGIILSNCSCSSSRSMSSSSSSSISNSSSD